MKRVNNYTNSLHKYIYKFLFLYIQRFKVAYNNPNIYFNIVIPLVMDIERNYME